MNTSARVFHTRAPFDRRKGRSSHGVLFEPTSVEPTLVGKLFALRSVRPFDRLSDEELTLVASIAKARFFEADDVVHPGGEPLSRLLVVHGGIVIDDEGRNAGPIIGVASMLNRTPVPRLRADATSIVRALSISRRHFYTLAGDCPEFVLGLLEIGERGEKVT